MLCAHFYVVLYYTSPLLPSRCWNLSTKFSIRLHVSFEFYKILPPFQRRIFIFGALGYFKLGALLEGRGGNSHIFRLRLHSCSKIFESVPGSENFQIWESDSYSDSGCHLCNWNSATFYLRNAICENHTDSCCWKWKVTQDPYPFFHKFLTPAPGPKEKCRILPESTPALRIRSHI